MAATNKLMFDALIGCGTMKMEVVLKRVRNH